jgi:hypothetical protein
VFNNHAVASDITHSKGKGRVVVFLTVSLFVNPDPGTTSPNQRGMSRAAAKRAGSGGTGGGGVAHRPPADADLRGLEELRLPAHITSRGSLSSVFYKTK